jgi:hypothetical protein
MLQPDSPKKNPSPTPKPEPVQALLPQPLPEIFINDEDIYESQKNNSSMVSDSRNIRTSESFPGGLGAVLTAAAGSQPPAQIISSQDQLNQLINEAIEEEDRLSD